MTERGALAIVRRPLLLAAVLMFSGGLACGDTIGIEGLSSKEGGNLAVTRNKQRKGPQQTVEPGEF